MRGKVKLGYRFPNFAGSSFFYGNSSVYHPAHSSNRNIRQRGNIIDRCWVAMIFYQGQLFQGEHILKALS
jgi:hypothetical protein